MTLADFLAALAGGTLTYPAALWIFRELPAWGITLSARGKRAAVYIISFMLAAGALLIAAALGYTTLTPESLFVAFTAAFATSQALHAALEMRSHVA